MKLWGKHAIPKDIPEIYKPQKENANCTYSFERRQHGTALKVISARIHYNLSV